MDVVIASGVGEVVHAVVNGRGGDQEDNLSLKYGPHYGGKNRDLQKHILYRSF